MENATVDTKLLASEWERLTFDLNLKGRLDFEVFKKTFAETFNLLRPYTVSDVIKKEYMDVIVKAYAVVTCEAEIANCYPQAAAILTERMLHHCVVNTAAADASGINIYLVESKKEVYINFEDIDYSIEVLAQAIEGVPEF